MENKRNLSSASSGQIYFVIATDVNGMHLKRLESMGIIPGAELDVLSNEAGTPLLVAVGESRLMVDRAVADQVIIA
ncbi:MAG: ferrous iron transport protein A [Halodesulfovibrio sp.]|uniref:FeoA family protein n=1 Tax=Halodesulfovibrio sp. TaxID=1912772 RepID=UPI00359E74B6